MDKRARAKGASSRLLSMMSTRSWYAGEVAGMLNLAEDKTQASNSINHEGQNIVADRLIAAVSKACLEGNNEEHRSALWRTTSLLISVSGIYCTIFKIFCILNVLMF